jgi:hypothetical protein
MRARPSYTHGPCTQHARVVRTARTVPLARTCLALVHEVDFSVVEEAVDRVLRRRVEVELQQLVPDRVLGEERIDLRRPHTCSPRPPPASACAEKRAPLLDGEACLRQGGRAAPPATAARRAGGGSGTVAGVVHANLVCVRVRIQG